MKTLFLLLAWIPALQTVSQTKESGIVLSKGQNITVRITSTQDADMGMGMEMKNITSSQNNIYVIDVSDKKYTVSNTLTGLKVSMDAMGQQTDYDSDLKKDSASDIGKSIKNLNVPDTFFVNKYTADISSNKKESPVSKADDSNPMAGLFESLGDKGADLALSEAFFIIPAGKKTGDSWSDSSSTKDQKISNSYRIQTIEKNNATVIISGNVISNIQTETNGMQLNVAMTTKKNTEVIVDVTSSLVSKRITKATIEGTLEMMGQSLPISGKSETTAVYEY